jgi:hypothetical protein
MKIIKLQALFILCISALLLSGTQAAQAQSFEPGKTYFDEENWTEFIVGDMPLVITVPHGGATLLSDIPMRDCKGAVTVTDSRTIELAREMQMAFLKKYGKRPFMVICHLSRKNVDQNRDMEEATCGNVQMQKPWNAFHNYADTALAMAVRQFGSSLYIDLHGHGHPNQRLELGYSLNAADLPDLGSKKDVTELAQKSSLQNLLIVNNTESSKTSDEFKKLMIGDHSFGTLITAAGSPAVPSRQDPYISDGGKYFNGGYNTRRYTSSKYPQVFGWQIESNYKGVRDPAGRPVFAKVFADSIMEFLKKNTGLKGF